MSKRTVKTGVMFLVVAGMLSLGSNGANNGGNDGAGGCATTGAGSAATGAGLGAITGAIIGHQQGRAWEGAALGAIGGAFAGWVVHEVQQQQVASRQEVEDRLRAEGQEVPDDPDVKIEQMTVNPDKGEPGGQIVVNGAYTALGSYDPPQGKYRIFKDGHFVAERDVEEELELENVGLSQFAIPITLPRDAAAGDYDVEVELNNGDSEAISSAQFEVA